MHNTLSINKTLYKTIKDIKLIKIFDTLPGAPMSIETIYPRTRVGFCMNSPGYLKTRANSIDSICVKVFVT